VLIKAKSKFFCTRHNPRTKACTSDKNSRCHFHKCFVSITALHVQTVITTCAQTLYALRVLRAHGLCDSALQIIFRAVIVAKLMYGSSAWWGFASATDRQKVEAFIQCCTRAGFYTPDPHYDFQELCNEADHRLFNKILESQYHVLEQLLPPTLPQSYDFRK